ncbi:MAG TPA: NADH:ubiquinone reductase (Na(+)-transporting) subunit C [Bacteroidales bacterium]|nr:NADH:ubiquinone reductase (Na(+)-transporting) subunit C [Bacteroidales bacterium]
MERSNSYIFIYSIVMVVVVAALLSIASYSLKDTQKSNVRKEKMQNILSSIQIESTPENVEELYTKYIINSSIIDAQGKLIPYVLEPNGKIFDTVRAFDVDMKKLYALPRAKRTLPLFEAQKEGEKFVIIPLRGKGLWGPVWGYVALQDDNNTVYGAVFDHQGETPGLGAEINKDKFEHMFKGKQLFDTAGTFVSVKVKKGGAAPDDIHGVDAISGGTITSNGVNDMIDTCVSSYASYLQSNKQ